MISSETSGMGKPGMGKPGQLVFRTDLAFNGVKVFTATIAGQRVLLGDRITAWLTEHPHRKIVEITVTQSSDAAFHMLAFVVAYWDPPSIG